MKKYTINKTFGSHSGKVHIQVTGFHLQELISMDELSQTLALLPNSHLEGLKEITYDPTRQIQTLYSHYLRIFKNRRSQGEFIKSLKTIVVYQLTSLAQLQKVILHEIGHFVFYCIIDSRIRKQWVTQIYPDSRFISFYATRNASEDFAESYSAFILTPQKLKRIPTKYQFMQTQIFQHFSSLKEHELDIHF